MLKNELIEYINKAPEHLLTVENLVSVSGKTPDNIRRHFAIYVEARLNPTVPVATIERLLKPMYESIDELNKNLQDSNREVEALKKALHQAENNSKRAFFNAVLSRIECADTKRNLCTELKLNPDQLTRIFRAEEQGFDPEKELNMFKHAGASNMKGMRDYPHLYGRDASRWCMAMITSKPYQYDVVENNHKQWP